jgi:hypothetical protein
MKAAMTAQFVTDAFIMVIWRTKPYLLDWCPEPAAGQLQQTEGG